MIARQRSQLRKGMAGLRREGFRTIHTLHSQEEVDAAEILLEPLWTDRRTVTGPFDIIGDVHGCSEELVELLEARLRDRGWRRAPSSRAGDPDGRRLVFLGDLVDRGPDTPACCGS